MKLLSMRHALCVLFFLALSGAVFSQTIQTVRMKTGAHRQVITAYSQQQTLRLEQLQAGETYALVIPKDASLSSCQPDFSHIQSNAELINYDPKARAVNFKATASTAELVLRYPCEWNEANPPRHYISIACRSCQTEKKTIAQADLAPIEVEALDGEELVRNILIGGECFDVSNVTFSGNMGRFSHGQSNIKIAEGVILATGDINLAVGPNDVNGIGDGGSGGSDPDLGSIATGPLFDISILEFDFVPTKSQLAFSYAFASEEYCEYVNTQFNDVFGFFISGPGIVGTKNIAVVPATNTPVTINTINHVVNQSIYVPNTPVGLDNCEDGGVSGDLPPQQVAFGPATYELQYDGFTREMLAVAEVIPCSTYHIKMAIGDVGDGVWDSAVFLKANSFDAGGNVLAAAEYSQNQESALEGCADGAIHFTRGTSDLSLPVVVNFTVSSASTATADVDYFMPASPVVIPAGESELIVPVNVFSDNLTEGEEFFTLIISDNCKCQQEQVQFLINDNVAFTATINQDTVVCAGFPALLTAVVEGGIEPYSYAWSSGDSLSFTTVTPNISTVYSLTVTDACGGTATDEAFVDVLPTAHDTISVGFCAGDSLALPGQVFYESGTLNVTLVNTNGCDSIVTYIVTELLYVSGVDTLLFCTGDSIQIGGQFYSEAGVAVDTISTAAGCDSIVTYTLVLLPLAYGEDTIRFCPGDSVQIAGQFYTETGIILDTLVSSNGCDSIVRHTLELLI